MLKELWMTLLLPDSRKLKTFGQVCEFNFALKGDKNVIFLHQDHPDYPKSQSPRSYLPLFSRSIRKAASSLFGLFPLNMPLLLLC